jgi:hypothetical protein
VVDAHAVLAMTAALFFESHPTCRGRSMSCIYICRNRCANC